MQANWKSGRASGDKSLLGDAGSLIRMVGDKELPLELARSETDPASIERVTRLDEKILKWTVRAGLAPMLIQSGILDSKHFPAKDKWLSARLWSRA